MKIKLPKLGSLTGQVIKVRWNESDLYALKMDLIRQAGLKSQRKANSQRIRGATA